jgi:hypothetical protein
MEKIESPRNYIVIKYKAKDGRIFQTEKECLQYEQLLDYQRITYSLPHKNGWIYCGTEEELTAAQQTYLSSSHVWNTDKQDLPDWFKFEFDDGGDYSSLITTSLKTIKREIAELELVLKSVEGDGDKKYEI